MRTLGSMSRGALRRLTSWPLKLVSENLRAEALEGLSEKMIASMPVPGGCIRFYAPTSLLRSRATTLLSKEPETIQWIDGFKDGVVLWDIGANVGVYALYAAIRRKASVLAFEPSAPNFHVLSRNIHLNSLTATRHGVLYRPSRGDGLRCSESRFAVDGLCNQPVRESGRDRRRTR